MRDMGQTEKRTSEGNTKKKKMDKRDKSGEAHKHGVALVVVRTRAVAGHDLAFPVEVGGIKELEMLVAQLAAWGEVPPNVV